MESIALVKILASDQLSATSELTFCRAGLLTFAADLAILVSADGIPDAIARVKPGVVNVGAWQQANESTGTQGILTGRRTATANPANSGNPLCDPDTGKIVGSIIKVLAKESKEVGLEKPCGIAYTIPFRHGKEVERDVEVSQ